VSLAKARAALLAVAEAHFEADEAARDRHASTDLKARANFDEKLRETGAKLRLLAKEYGREKRASRRT
jgi:hypothetical protein